MTFCVDYVDGLSESEDEELIPPPPKRKKSNTAAPSASSISKVQQGIQNDDADSSISRDKGLDIAQGFGNLSVLPRELVMHIFSFLDFIKHIRYVEFRNNSFPQKKLPSTHHQFWFSGLENFSKPTRIS